MLKIFETEAFFEGEPTVSVIDVNSVNGLVKKAADSKIIEFVSKLSTDPDKVFIHVLAMGASEYYSCNRNGDWFPEENLKKYFSTFETNPAHFYRHHQNKDPSIAGGRVIFSIWNDKMKRVELIVELDRTRTQDLIDKLDRGEFPSTSMACRTPYDTCSICGNVAKTRQEYCVHLREELGRMHPDGKKTYAINNAPLSFFDISYVFRPADVLSGVLQKVASTKQVTGSAELAEIEGLQDCVKAASHRKLSEFIKEVTGTAISHDSSLESILNRVKDPASDSIDRLCQYELSQIFTTMATLGISPSIGFLAEIIGRKIAGNKGEGIGPLVEGFVLETGVENLPSFDKDFSKGEVHPGIVQILSPSVKQASLFPRHVTGRIMEGVSGVPVQENGRVYVPGTNYGYVGNGPHLEPTPQEIYKGLLQEPNAGSGGISSMIKSLLSISLAAIAAKWYITQQIKEHSEQLNKNNLPTKILLVKAANLEAQEAQITSNLADFSMRHSLGLTRVQRT